MKKLELKHGEIEYQVQGAGEPVIFIHGSILADSNLPLLTEPAIASNYKVISYHRRGLGNSSRAASPFSIKQQAADASSLLRHLNIASAHVVGHSYGGAIAMQWTLDKPEEVHSLSLLEPAVTSTPSWHTLVEGVQSIRENFYNRGNHQAAVEAFLSGVVGPDFQQYLDKFLPEGAFELAISDIPTFFEVEFPALDNWSFSKTEAKKINKPVLSVLGEDSTPMFQEGHAIIKSWFTQSNELIIPQANHGLPYVNPCELAKGLANFFAQNKLQ